MKYWTLLFVANVFTLTCWSLAGNSLLIFIYSVAAFSSGMLALGEWVDRTHSEG